jgi:hypothetical protein
MNMKGIDPGRSQSEVVGFRYYSFFLAQEDTGYHSMILRVLLLMYRVWYGKYHNREYAEYFLNFLTILISHSLE